MLRGLVGLLLFSLPTAGCDGATAAVDPTGEWIGNATITARVHAVDTRTEPAQIDDQRFNDSFRNAVVTVRGVGQRRLAVVSSEMCSLSFDETSEGHARLALDEEHECDLELGDFDITLPMRGSLSFDSTSLRLDYHGARNRSDPTSGLDVAYSYRFSARRR